MPLFTPPLLPGIIRVGYLAAANMNSTADQAIAIVLPPGITLWQLNAVQATNPTGVALTSAAGGFYTAASKAGTALIAAGQSYAGLVSATPNAASSVLACTANAGATVIKLNVLVIYFSLTTGAGGAATADLEILARPLLS